MGEDTGESLQRAWELDAKSCCRRIGTKPLAGARL